MGTRFVGRWVLAVAAAFATAGCQRVYLVDPSAVELTEEEARGILGNEGRVFERWGALESLTFTSYDIYHIGEQSVVSKIVWTVLGMPFFLVQAPFFGLPEEVEARFGNGRRWRGSFQRHWLWLAPLHPSEGWAYAQAMAKLCWPAPGEGEPPDGGPAP